MQQTASALLSHAAGFVGSRTIAIGLRAGLVRALADSEASMTADALADQLDLDARYVAVWCRAAVAAGVVDTDVDEVDLDSDARYRLAAHVGHLLLDEGPAHIGGIFTVFEHPEMIDRFEESLADGRRWWWDDCSPAFIDAVATTGRPFYERLVRDGLDRVPGLRDRLAGPARILDTASGSGHGAILMARTWPEATVVGADGDEHSVEVARRNAREAEVDDRVEFVCTPLEELEVSGPFALVTNNISMHECRDADLVTANVHGVLERGGVFAISDFPFPREVAGLRTVPGRLMTGIQYYEAQIDDQLLPRDVYDDLLHRHGFRDVDHVELSPTHAVTHGRR